MPQSEQEIIAALKSLGYQIKLQQNSKTQEYRVVVLKIDGTVLLNADKDAIRQTAFQNAWAAVSIFNYGNQSDFFGTEDEDEDEEEEDTD